MASLVLPGLGQGLALARVIKCAQKAHAHTLAWPGRTPEDERISSKFARRGAGTLKTSAPVT
jgi:hypothetical protein